MRERTPRDMHDDHACDLPDPERVSFQGPFQHHDVVVEGWRVPLVQAHLKDGGRVVLVLDRRLGLELSTEEAERVTPFLADAIAVALGYGAHPRGEGENPPARAPYPRPERVVDFSLTPESA